MKKYFIVGNKPFTLRADAIKYCTDCDFDPETMIEEENE